MYELGRALFEREREERRRSRRFPIYKCLLFQGRSRQKLTSRERERKEATETVGWFPKEIKHT